MYASTSRNIFSCAGVSVEVDDAGMAEITVGPLDAVALHVGARLE